MIRLQRLGKKKSPCYRLIVSEKARDTQYGFLEKLGFYNPFSKEKKLEANEERIKYWLSVGAQPSATVHNLFLRSGLLSGKKKKVVKISKKRAGKLAAKKAVPAA